MSHMTASGKVNLSHCVTHTHLVPRLRPLSLLVKAFKCCRSHTVICKTCTSVDLSSLLWALLWALPYIMSYTIKSFDYQQYSKMKIYFHWNNLKMKSSHVLPLSKGTVSSSKTLVMKLSLHSYLSLAVGNQSSCLLVFIWVCCPLVFNCVYNIERVVSLTTLHFSAKTSCYIT